MNNLDEDSQILNKLIDNLISEMIRNTSNTYTKNGDKEAK